MPFTIHDLEKLKQKGTIRGWVDNGKAAEKKKSKYGNRKVTYDNMVFDSEKEGGRYLTLRARKLAGEITDLKCQVPFELTIEGDKVAKYIADFTYMENGEMIVEDVKSKFTRRLPVYRLKKKMMLAIHAITINEV